MTGLLKPHAIEKVWGQERIIVNDGYCGKAMLLFPGYQCSLHRHARKDETFYVEDGNMLLETGEDPKLIGLTKLRRGDAVRIPPGMWHRFYTFNPSGCLFFEFSTHHDDADVERLEPSGRLP